MSTEFELFKGKNLSSLFEDIYNNQLAEATVERENKLKAEENIMLGFEKKNMNDSTKFLKSFWH